MLSINTNLQSLLVQSNLNNSTNSLNMAIERMTTGYKINHASDNAANYSISQNMVSKLSSYDIATDNISAGIDLVRTAQDTISLMQSHGQRIHALITQAQNGTYGEQSLEAINSEVKSRIDEINRLFKTTEYNGISLLEGVKLPDWTEDVRRNAGAKQEGAYKSFLDDPFYKEGGVRVSDETINSWTHVASVAEITDLTEDKYAISTADDLAKLAELVNDGADTSGITFVMGADIDLTSYCKQLKQTNGYGWTAIGTESDQFNGTFDGNGHKITGVNIDRPEDYQGLFGYTSTSSTIKNVGVEDVYVKGQTCAGGLVGKATGTVSNSYSKGTVKGAGNTGGLVGYARNAISNSYATGSVTATGSYTGGLVGYAKNSVNNSYSTSTVSGGNNTGGLIGHADGTISNSYATGSVTGETQTGGLTGYANTSVSDSYATGSVTGTQLVGGLAGYAGNAVNNCYATGSVTGQDSTSKFIGGLIGQLRKTSGTITNENICSAGDVSSSGEKAVGALIGGIVNTTNGINFSTITIKKGCTSLSGNDYIGGVYSTGSGNPEVEDYDMSDWLSNISDLPNSKITLHVGINGNDSSSITFNCAFSYDLTSITKHGAENEDSYDVINNFISTLSDRATTLGAVTNRLESALDSTMVSVQNLTSSLSTIRDADVAKESSSYIKSQILQQAAATLLATANQSPSIALQLI